MAEETGLVAAMGMDLAAGLVGIVVDTDRVEDRDIAQGRLLAGDTHMVAISDLAGGPDLDPDTAMGAVMAVGIGGGHTMEGAPGSVRGGDGAAGGGVRASIWALLFYMMRRRP